MQTASTAGVRLIGWLHAARRLQTIGLVLARHGFGEVVDRAGLYVPRPLSSARATGAGGAEPPPTSTERMAARLVEVLTELGPTYIKLGQLLATRADLFPPAFVQALSRLHAEVRPLPGRDVARQIERELGKPPSQLFAHFELQPLAAASIGQVHRARLRDGSEVVVKVQRPGLDKQVEADLSIMRLFAQLLAQQLPELAAYQPLALVEAFASSIRLELDFRNEAANADKLRSLLGGAREVHVPRVHAEWTTRHVLVMEFVAGTRLSALTPTDRGRVRQALLRAFVRQMIEHGVFHADPHPGNLLALSDGRVALLDLGTINVLDERMRGGLFRLGLALLLQRSAALSHEVIGLAEVDPGAQLDRLRLERDIEALVRASSGPGGGALIGRMLDMSRTHSLRLPAPLLALMRALAILDGVLRGLDPARDLVRDLRRELAWAGLRRLRSAIESPFRRWSERVTRLLRGPRALR